jgi:hypothetical protein
VNRPPDTLTNVPRLARVIDCKDGRIIVSRVSSEAVCVELHHVQSTELYRVSFIEIDLQAAKALAIALEEVSK